MCRQKRTKSLNSIELVLCAAVAFGAIPAAFAQQDDVQAPQNDIRDPADAEEYFQSLRSARDGLIMAKDYEAALSPAELVVSELAEAENPELPREQVVLAFVLAELKRYDEAEAIYFEAIDKIKQEAGELSEELVLPMHLLGRSYMGARMFPEAITVLTEAQAISRRNEGLFNVQQSTLIDDMTTAYLGMGDTISAQKLQVDRLDNAIRRFGADDPRVIPFHNELASYYQKSRLRIQAREQYKDVLDIQEAQFGPLDASLLAPLREMAKIDLILGERRTNLERIEEILANNDSVPAVERGLSLALLGDSALVDNEHNEAADYYQQSFASLEKSGEIDPNEYFKNPAIISLSPPLTPVDRGLSRRPYSWGTIVVQFDVNADGRVSQITGVGAEPSGKVEDAYIDRLNDAVFRPQIVDGTPVEAKDIKFTHYFRYYVEKPDKKADK